MSCSFGTGHPLGEPHLLVRVLGVEVDEVQQDEPGGEVQRGLDRVGEPALRRGLGREPVDDDLDGVLLLLVELRRAVDHVGELDRLAVDPCPAETLRLQAAEELDVLTLAAADDRREHLEAGALLELQDAVDDLLGGLSLDRRAALGAVRPAGPRVQQPEVVVDLGDGADRRARVLRRGLLVDRDRRAQALDEVDVGLVHLSEELAGVRRERLDVAALTLGEDGVEGEARLARPGETGEHDQGVAGEVDRDVLEVVLARAPDDELISHGRDPCSVCGMVRTSVRHPNGCDKPPRRRRQHERTPGHRQHRPLPIEVLASVRRSGFDGAMSSDPVPSENVPSDPAPEWDPGDLTGLDASAQAFIRTVDALAPEELASPVAAAGVDPRPRGGPRGAQRVRPRRRAGRAGARPAGGDVRVRRAARRPDRGPRGGRAQRAA